MTAHRTERITSVTIRNLSGQLKARLRVRAAQHGRSMEEEVREILRTALAEEPTPPESLAAAIRQRFARLGGVELSLEEREPMRDPPDLDP